MKKYFSLVFAILVLFQGCGYGRNNIKINDNLTLRLQRESKHFKFYCSDVDRKCLNDLQSKLEGNYSRITSDLQCNLKKKVDIEIYPDITTFHKVIGQPDASDALIGMGGDNKVKILSPLNPGKYHNYDSIVVATIHELTHVIINSINSNTDSIPNWLNEGIAFFEAKQLNNNTKMLLVDKVEQKKIPSLNDIEAMQFPNPDGYLFSYSIVDFIISQYGYSMLNDFIKNPSNIQSVFGISKDEFQNKWKEFLEFNYK